ncbi:hypothetical protein EMIHUDRAFT_462475 [Emiliania huxleyi CCMP1516]|uniref:PPM-type phosphatase domain-containing protein n=2 Tax=Emiliania huxleyi TaxID=2903 RepID=A0A0D3KIF2_EMIH1|nr:hypothetical protein EMIHUDRAFT_462475 [Emiliania huxleyi CCMP1516]EOD35537.1 hypothetical protein EMIHUDRAFT_462475 [Emiliania huxleyi CCMP1516]|eukprot:XP_005787966.1 hypothetical protein EMIHUDRAFT_462475 [Emiliania huxleyi CCMP1516]
MDVAASYNQRLPWPAVMDVSPEDRPVAIRTSSMGSTPLDTHAKRLRSEAELDSCPLHEPDEPPLKRMEFTPCHSPTRAEQTPPEDMASVMPPRRLASVGFGTPISGHPICCPLVSELRLRYGMHQTQGPRNSMEDRTVCKLERANGGFAPSHGFFAVLDGHGGSAAAEHCAERLHANLVGSHHFPDLVPALQDAFLRTDASFLSWAASPGRRAKARRLSEPRHTPLTPPSALSLPSTAHLQRANAKQWRPHLCTASLHRGSQLDGPTAQESHAGAAAVALVVTPNHLTVGRSPTPPLARWPREALTHDHVAERSICAEEADRVERAGASNVPGSVRVGEHDLPMTRAFGNLRLKVAAGRDWTQEAANAQVVTALPDVSVFARGPDDLAVVVASDGLFGEVLSSEHVAEYTRAALQENAATGDAEGMAARRLVERAIHHQSSDNVSVVVVSLEPSEGSAASPDLAQESPDLLREDSTATQSFSPGRRVASSEAYPEEVRARRSLSPEEERS